MSQLLAEIEEAAQSGAHGLCGTCPSDAQHVAGNYKKGRVTILGMPIVIEQPRYSIRSGVSSQGKEWSTRMFAHYGYFSGVMGADGDELDVFIGPAPEADTLYVVNQVFGNKFDEHKVMLGFLDEQDARTAYLNSYARDWDGLGSIVAISLDDFKRWIAQGVPARPLSSATDIKRKGNLMNKKIAWDSAAMPVGATLDQILYGLRLDDDDGAIYEPVSLDDVMGDSDDEAVFDSLVMPFSQMQHKMNTVKRVLDRSGKDLTINQLDISEPFTSAGSANVAAVFGLSDGQSITVYMHNPDTDPKKILPTDSLVSWKWLLNRKDITIAVAPEKGADLNIREVARRIMQLAEKNSARFTKNKARVQANAAIIEAAEKENQALETELESARQELAELEAKAGDALVVSLSGTGERRLVKVANMREASKVVSEYVTENNLDADSFTGGQLYKAGEQVSDITSVGNAFDLEGGAIDIPAPSVVEQVAEALLSSGWEKSEDGSFKNTLSSEGEVLNVRLTYDGEELHAYEGDEVGELAFLAFPNGDLTAESAVNEIYGLLDDELEARIASKTIDVDPDALGEFTDDEEGKKARRAATKEYLETLRGVMVNVPALNADVEIRKRGIKKTMAMTANPVKLKMLADIKQIIATAKNPIVEKNYKVAEKRNVELYYRLSNKVSIDGDSHHVTVLIEKDTDGMLHYDLLLEAKTKTALDSAVDVDQSIPDHNSGDESVENNGTALDSGQVLDSDEPEQSFDDAGASLKPGVMLNLFIEGEEPEVLEAEENELIASEEAEVPEQYYQFANITPEFEQWLVDRSDDVFSPLETAKAMDAEAKNHGLTIEWGFFGGSLDSVLLDSIDDEGYQGKVKRGSTVVGRIELGGDGKAMVYIGDKGEDRIRLLSGVVARYSDYEGDAGEMITALAQSLPAEVSQPEEAPAPQAPKTLEEIDPALYRDFKSSLNVIRNIDAGTEKGYDRSLFVNSIAGKLKTRAKNGENDLVDAALNFIATENSKVPKALITSRNAIWRLTGKDYIDYPIVASEPALPTTQDEPAASAGVPDLYYSKVDELFTSFTPNTPSGEEAWRQMADKTDGTGKVLHAQVEGTIAQLQEAGYTVAEGSASNDMPSVSDDELLAELTGASSDGPEQTEEPPMAGGKDFDAQLKGRALDQLEGISKFIPVAQKKIIVDMIRNSQEWRFFADKVLELTSIIDGMAKTYEQDGKGMDATAYLHYFGGAADWYITEKDMDGGVKQAFGWADLGQGGGELGYISIEEITSISSIELDLHFDPKTVNQAIGRSEEPEQEPTESPEAVPEITQEEAAATPDNDYLNKVISGGLDLLDPAVAEELEAIYERNQGDEGVMSLFNQAIDALQEAMMNATGDLS
jgi:hypothetical protein